MLLKMVNFSRIPKNGSTKEIYLKLRHHKQQAFWHVKTSGLLYLSGLREEWGWSWSPQNCREEAGMADRAIFEDCDWAEMVRVERKVTQH